MNTIKNRSIFITIDNILIMIMKQKIELALHSLLDRANILGINWMEMQCFAI